jgi:hypothetical protein
MDSFPPGAWGTGRIQRLDGGVVGWIPQREDRMTATRTMVLAFVLGLALLAASLLVWQAQTASGEDRAQACYLDRMADNSSQPLADCGFVVR